jgi:hypothetical protein
MGLYFQNPSNPETLNEDASGKSAVYSSVPPHFSQLLRSGSVGYCVWQLTHLSWGFIVCNVATAGFKTLYLRVAVVACLRLVLVGENSKCVFQQNIAVDQL